jgi:hypothetical protein
MFPQWVQNEIVRAEDKMKLFRELYLTNQAQWYRLTDKSICFSDYLNPALLQVCVVLKAAEKEIWF